MLFPKHPPKGGDGVCLEKAPETRPDFGKQDSSGDSQTSPHFAINWELLKDTDTWAHPGDFALVGLVWDCYGYF